jgi:A/G-specific adenine glycosylase
MLETRVSGTASIEPSTHSAIARALCGWFERHRRALPWRRTRDPYAVWVSEIMLQQTQVATVLPYYERWMRRFPTLESLARADEADVLHAWQGLGYYSRARNLLAGARQVQRQHGGHIPPSVSELLELPGVGPYSAGAIASIAYDVPAPIVDGNVTRVLCRLFGLRGDPSRAPLKAQLWRLAAELVPAIEPGNFNQALMELGATVCTPKQPNCRDCPVARSCVAEREGRVLVLPEMPKRPEPTKLRMVAAVVVQRGRVLVTRLAEDAPRWAGMWQFPTTEAEPSEAPERAITRALSSAGTFSVTKKDLLTTVRHSVTRYRITLEAYRCQLVGTGRRGRAEAARWFSPANLDELAMPAAHRRIARQLRGSE